VLRNDVALRANDVCLTAELRKKFLRNFIGINNPSVSYADSSLYTREPYGEWQKVIYEKDITRTME